MADLNRRPFSIFSRMDEINVTRAGKNVMVKGLDGTFEESATVEANLLYEILKELRKKK